MAVQGHDKDLVLCEKCFAMVPSKADFCTECGAPLKEKGDGSDAAIYPELARANLLRMRGDFKGAEDVCLAILRRYPNNATANTLLGDIATERGDYEQAAEWYELALDIVPDSVADKEKLDRLKQRISEKEAAATAQQLGVPTRRSVAPLYIAIVVVFLIVAAAGAFVMNKQSKKGGSAKLDPNVNNEIKVGGGNPTGVAQPAPKTTPDPVDRGITERDRELFSLMAKETTVSAKVSLVQLLPGDKSVIVNYAVSEGEDVRALAGELAKAVLTVTKESDKDYLKSIERVDLRASRSGELLYSAKVTRDAYELTLTPDWKDTHKDEPSAWLDAVLTNEWRPESETKPAPEGAGTPEVKPEEGSNTGGSGSAPASESTQGNSGDGKPTEPTGGSGESTQTG